MKKLIIPALLIAGSFLFSCQQHQYIKLEGFTQGTIYKITYENQNGIVYEEEIKQLFQDFSASLSTYLSTSLISRINQNDTTVVIDDYFRTMFNKAAEVNKESEGVFDITIAPIVNLWGFGFTGNTPDIHQDKIDSLLQCVGMNKIRIEGDRVVKDSPGVMLDGNAIAKGFSVDVVADFLKNKGCRNFLVNVGGEIVAHGVNPDGHVWYIEIEKPIENAVWGASKIAVVRLNNRAMATSGNYRRFFEIDGKKYGHTFDVKTGYPATTDLLSATIVADDCITADAWATVCLASGLAKSIQILQQHSELDALLIYSDEKGDFKVHVTEGMNAIILK